MCSDGIGPGERPLIYSVKSTEIKHLQSQLVLFFFLSGECFCA